MGGVTAPELNDQVMAEIISSLQPSAPASAPASATSNDFVGPAYAGPNLYSIGNYNGPGQGGWDPGPDAIMNAIKSGNAKMVTVYPQDYVNNGYWDTRYYDNPVSNGGEPQKMLLMNGKLYTPSNDWTMLDVGNGQYQIRSRADGNVFNNAKVSVDQGGNFTGYSPTVYQTGSNNGGFFGSTPVGGALNDLVTMAQETAPVWIPAVTAGLTSGLEGAVTSEAAPVFEVAELPTEQLLNDYAAAASNAIVPEVANQPAPEAVVNPVPQGSVSESPLPALPDVIPDAPVETPQVSAPIPEPAATQTPVFSEVMELPTEDLLKQYDSVVPSVVDTKPTVKQPEVFSEVMEIPTEDLLKDYSNAALPPVEDLSTSSGTPISNPTISDIAAGAALGGAAGAVTGTALESLIPEIPAMPTYTPPKNNPDYTKKFDAPVQWGEVPTWNFTIGTEASPYLSQSQAGQFTGQMLFDPSQAYASGLLQALRSASNAPGAKNAGFTLFNTTK